MISIAASMVLYPKPLAWQYAGGLVSTIAGLGWMYAIKRRKLLAAGGRRRDQVTRPTSAARCEAEHARFFFTQF